jgi:hypothetical protein
MSLIGVDHFPAFNTIVFEEDERAHYFEAQGVVGVITRHENLGK